MKILHVVSSNQKRGAEVFAFDLMRHLAPAGLEQRVAVLRMHPEGLHYPSPVIDLDVEGRRNRPATMLRLDHALRDWCPDIVQTHGGEVLTSLLPTLVRSRPPVVHRRIGLTPDWMAGPVRKRVHGLPMRRAAAVIAVADVVAHQVIAEFRVPDGLVTTIPNGVDERRVRSTRDREDVRAQLDVPAEAAVALFVGALNDEKNPLDLVEVADRVIGERDAYFLVAGTGPLTDELRRAAGEAGLAGRFRLLGPRSDIAELMLASDALVMTSRTEGMPAAVIEAGLAGRCVAAYAVGGVPEVVINQVTGITVRPGDRVGLAAGLGSLFADSRRRDRLAASARMRCLELFEMKKVAARYLDLYEQIAARGTHRRSVVGPGDRSTILKESTG